MKRILSILVIALSISLVSCGQQGSSNNTATEVAQTATYSNVSVNDLKTAMDNEEIIVLDVRTPSEYSEGLIGMATNMNIKDEAFAAQAENLDKNASIYVYCRSGYRSQLASEKLISMGFTNVKNVEGGFLAWEENGFDVTK